MSYQESIVLFIDITCYYIRTITYELNVVEAISEVSVTEKRIIAPHLNRHTTPAHPPASPPNPRPSPHLIRK